MFKRIILFTGALIASFIVLFFLHEKVLEELGLQLNYSLLNVYLFFVISSIIVYIFVEVILEYIPQQAGYAYLMSMMIKLGIFMLIFNSAIFTEEKLEMFKRISIVIPMFIFLIIEAVGVSKQLMKSQ